MPDTSNLLRLLILERGWRKYETFKTQFENAAKELAAQAKDPRLASLSVGPRQFDRWCYGELKTLPYPDACQVLEYMFEHSIKALFAPVSSTSEAHESPTAEMMPSGQDASAFGMSGESMRPGSASPPPSEVEREVIMAAAHESSRHAGLVGSQRVDPTTLEQLHDDVVRIARQYPRTPPLSTFTEAVRVRNLACQLLERTRRPQQESDFYLIIGQLCGLLASVSFDLGYRDAAIEQARAAWLYGKHIGHHGLRAWARGMQALIAYWSGRPLEARNLAREAQEHAPTGTALIRLCSIEARALSYLGDVDETAHAIRAAQQAREHAHEDDDLHDEIGGEFSFDAARQARCHGSVYVQLGDAQSAIEEAQRAIRIYLAAPPEQRWPTIEFEAHADLAAAYLLQNELDGARAVLSPIFDLPPERRVEGLTQRLGQVRGMLTQDALRHSQEARQLGEQIEDFTANAIGRMLGSGFGLV